MGNIAELATMGGNLGVLECSGFFHVVSDVISSRDCFQSYLFDSHLMVKPDFVISDHDYLLSSHYPNRCIFVVGHDCGHGNFSESETLNDIIGHITHGSILVPYYPWQLSHRRHHMYHNHIDKDYSHPW